MFKSRYYSLSHPQWGENPTKHCMESMLLPLMATSLRGVGETCCPAPTAPMHGVNASPLLHFAKYTTNLMITYYLRSTICFMTTLRTTKHGIAGGPRDADYCEASQIIGVRVSRCVLHDRVDPYTMQISFRRLRGQMDRRKAKEEVFILCSIITHFVRVHRGKSIISFKLCIYRLIE